MTRSHDPESACKPPIVPKSLLPRMLRSGRGVSPDDREESQECFFEALEARTDEKEIRLLSRALKLDPGNADAWLRMLEYCPPESPEEEIEILRVIVAEAEERLGKKVFKKWGGHFWGYVETRPYMRARAALADALQRAGMTVASVAELEGMLELNPNDNQGLRYRLLAFYLMLGSLDGVRRLFARYPDEFDFNTVFAWAKVLERFLSDDLPAALGAMAAADRQNPSSKDYLLGRRRVPKTLPDSYAPGSKDEAACFAGDLLMAWKAHPTAKKWLKEMSPKKK